MKAKVFWALVALNALLLAVFFGQIARPNVAQAQNLRPSDYLMIPGEIIGGNAAVVYIVDTTNSQLGAMVFDDQHNALTAMPPIDLARVFEAAAAGSNPKRAPR